MGYIGTQPTNPLNDGDVTADKIETASLSPIIQIVNSTDGAVASLTTDIALDDTIPQQSTDGEQVLSKAITPKSSSNILKIDIVVNGSMAATSETIIAALYQDSTEDALAVVWDEPDRATSDVHFQLVLSHYMTAGTTSETTFKVYLGASTGGGNITFNGDAGSRYFGGKMSSSITIMEIQA